VRLNTAKLLAERQVLKRDHAMSASEVTTQINPTAWLGAFFAVGHSSRCFLYIRDWVDNKIRHHLARATQRHGSG
jgi:RNA-directed DNA polymerase